MVVACLFAGVGAWGASVTVGPNPVYASELFGEGHTAIKYPTDINPNMDGNQDGTPIVKLTIPANVPDGTNHNGSARITFKLSTGTFMSNITGLMWNAGGDAEDTAAPGTVATIVSGGRAGENEIVIEVKEAGADNDTDETRRAGDETGVKQTISFRMPRLQGLESLAGAAKTPKAVRLHVESRIVSGAFTDGKLSNKGPDPKAPGEIVVSSRDSLTLAIEASDGGMKTIAIKDDAAKGLTAFKSVKQNKDGYVELATVTITTQQVSKDAKSAAGEMVEFYLSTAATPIENPASAEVNCTVDSDGDPTNGFTPGPGCFARTSAIFTTATAGNKTEYHRLFDLDGKEIDEGLRGNFMVNAEGTRELFNEDDMLFVDYDGNGKMGGGEEIAIDSDMMNMATGRALSIDSDQSESFPDGINGNFKVFYKPGGKGDINHGAMIKLTAMVDYSDPTAKDETPAKSTTTLNFDGVDSEVMAYAIPHSTNGNEDKANVRVRCEASAGCRVFLECWDDDGMRNFGGDGEPIMIAGDALATWDAAAIEDVLDITEPTSRHSCRILSAGKVSVQQLTRDGKSKTLVNNTYVGQ